MVVKSRGEVMQTGKSKDKVKPPKLEMKIDIRVLEHLGLKMYTSLPAVIAEYVANSWDAGANSVNIAIPEGPVDNNYAITIDDDGQGMTIDEVNRKFLVVGRKKREEEGTETIIVNGKQRRVIGRKGLGKLAGFGVAGRVEIRTRKKRGFVEFRMDYDKMQRKLSEEDRWNIKTTYLPEVLDWGPTIEPDGTTVRLTYLKRERSVSIPDVRRNLARHFSVIGEDFIVSVNGERLTPAERELRAECEYIWEYENRIIDEKLGLTVSGWIGTMKRTVPPDVERGVVVMARGKLVQTPTTFDIGGKGITGQHALAYMVGEIHAEFLDEEMDLISTGRRSVIWEQEPAATLRQWLNQEIRRICSDWADKRREKKMQAIRELPVYKERIANLPKHERNIVDKILKGIAEREDVEEETVDKIANYIAEGIEYSAFLNLIEAIDEAGVTKPEVLIDFFKEWEVLDAIEMVKIVEGRLEAIIKFQELVRVRAREVPTMHDFLVDNPWLLDPTWDYMDDEVTYREILLKKFVESDVVPEENRRIDFLCLGYGTTLNVIEIKRPGYPISRGDLEKLELYRDEVDRLLGTDPRSYKTVVGYIIGGHLSQDAREKADRLELSAMYVRTYNDLVTATKRVHKRFIEILERKSKRIEDTRLLGGLARLKEKYREVEATGDQEQ
jgi:hypothetical protein